MGLDSALNAKRAKVAMFKSTVVRSLSKFATYNSKKLPFKKPRQGGEFTNFEKSHLAKFQPNLEQNLIFARKVAAHHVATFKVHFA